MSLRHGQWPHKIAGVSNHALVRYLQRVKGHDILSVISLLRAHPGIDRDYVLLGVLAARRVDLEAVRRSIRAEVDANKRSAVPWDNNKFLICGPTGRFVVAKDGVVVTCYRLSIKALLRARLRSA